MTIPRHVPAKLEVQSSPKGIVAGEEERHREPTDPEEAEVFSPCDPFCSEAILLYYTILSLPKGMGQWLTTIGSSEDCLTLARVLF